MRRRIYPLDKKILQKVLERDNWTCLNPFCGLNRDLTPHHIIKKSLGGKDDPANIMTLCVRCHRRNEDGILKIKFTEDGKSLWLDDRKIGMGMILDRSILNC